MKHACGVRSDAELATVLGVSRGAPANWRKDGVPSRHLVTIAQRYPVVVEWLQAGVGSANAHAGPGVVSVEELALALVDAEQTYREDNPGREPRASQLADRALRVLIRHRTWRELFARTGSAPEEWFAQVKKDLGLPDDWQPGDPW
jgi:hypothetical protein